MTGHFAGGSLADGAPTETYRFSKEHYAFPTNRISRGSARWDAAGQSRAATGGATTGSSATRGSRTGCPTTVSSATADSSAIRSATAGGPGTGCPTTGSATTSRPAARSPRAGGARTSSATSRSPTTHSPTADRESSCGQNCDPRAGGNAIDPPILAIGGDVCPKFPRRQASGSSAGRGQVFARAGRFYAWR
jgi:hypothetical protein